MLIDLKKLKLYSITIFAVLVLSACGGSENDGGEGQSVERGALLSSETIAEYDKPSALSFAVLAAGAGRAYDIEVVELTYNTALESGDIVKASGTISFPKDKAGASPLLSYQHATIFSDGSVPSNDPMFDFTPAYAATAGFVVVAPDYIGYGASNNKTHPFIQSVPTANSVLDLIRAARVFAAERGLMLNNQLFLAGYSEGAYASMAAHQQMETNYPDEFTVTGSVIGSGPYDVRGTVDDMLLNPQRIESPATIGYMVHAYDRYYELDNLTVRAIASPHHLTVDDYYDGSRNSSAINSILPRQTDELFDSYFLSDYAGIAGELTLKYRLDQNNVYDWAPNAPIRLFHGADDEIVPYASSIQAVSQMNEYEGVDVTLTDCQITPTTHVNCAAGYAKFALDYLLDESTDR